MAPTYERYRSTTLATWMMLELYHSYDAGGHSGRSIKSRLLESALLLQEIPRRHRRINRAFLDDLPHLMVLRRIRRGPPQPLLFPELPHLSNEEFTSVVLWYVAEENREHWGEVSIIEKRLLEGMMLLLETEWWRGQLSGQVIEPELLIQEGRRRRLRQLEDRYPV